jgi:hypothetical protein
MNDIILWCKKLRKTIYGGEEIIVPAYGGLSFADRY